jgi:hypothetical protein
MHPLATIQIIINYEIIISRINLKKFCLDLFCSF